MQFSLKQYINKIKIYPFCVGSTLKERASFKSIKPLTTHKLTIPIFPLDTPNNLIKNPQSTHLTIVIYSRRVYPRVLFASFIEKFYLRFTCLEKSYDA